MSEAAPSDGAYESKDEVKSRADFVRMWLDAIAVADNEEKPWRETATKAVEIYRQDKKATHEFNILHSNTETIVPAIYNSPPVPDVRRRFSDPDPVAKKVADVLERSISYSIDAYDFDDTLGMAVMDGELPGRGLVLVEYIPHFGTDPIMGPDGKPALDEAGEETMPVVYEEVRCRVVPWKMFRHGPGRQWDEVPWVAIEEHLTRDELAKLNPRLAGQVPLDVCVKPGADSKDTGIPDILKRAKVWRIWDRDAREIIFIAESYRDAPLKREKDLLGIEGFFPMPRPYQPIRTTDTLVPVCPWDIYKRQARELDRLTKRIDKVTEGIKARGLYGGDKAADVIKLEQAEDNELVPVQNVAAFATGNGKLEDAIAWWPIETLMKVLQALYQAREQVKQTIYEITGISDILRGSSDPNETLGAQEIKTQWGSLRIQRKQKEVQRFARDIFRIKAEIIAAKFSRETLEMMTGVKLTDQEMELLRSGVARSYRIDVESDSTIRGDMQRAQTEMGTFLQGTAQFMQAMGPIAMQYPQAAPAMMEIYAAFARRFKLGKQAEDTLDQLADSLKQVAEQPSQPQDPANDPKVKAEEAKAEAAARKAEVDMAIMDRKDQRDQATHEREMQRMQVEATLEAQPGVRGL